MHATRSGELCNETGTYRCVGCRVAMHARSGRPFPECPVCNRPTQWANEKRFERDDPDERPPASPRASNPPR